MEAKKEYKLEVYCYTKDDLILLVDAMTTFFATRPFLHRKFSPFREFGAVVKVEHHHYELKKIV